MQSTTVDKTVLAKETTLYSGPKNFNPANAPLRSVTFGANPLTGHAGGATDTYKMVFGDRNETFLFGNHSTNVIIGNLSYQTGVGAYRAQAGGNFLNLDTTSGMSAVVSVGTMTMTSTTTASITGVGAASMSSTTGPARVSGLSTFLGGQLTPKTKFGAIIAESDIDPTSGKPFSFYLMGSSNHLLVPHTGP